MPWPTTSRQSRGYGAEWDRLRLRILARDFGLCQPCRRAGAVKQGTEVDHVVPRAKGGSEDDDNLQTICSDCHKAKTLTDEGRSLRPTVAADGVPDGW